jgi:hypothetical protein
MSVVELAAIRCRAQTPERGRRPGEVEHDLTEISRMDSIFRLDGAPQADVRQSKGSPEMWARPA